MSAGRASMLCHEQRRAQWHSLCQNALNRIAGYISQSVVAARMAVRELLVIDAKQVQNRCLEIVDMDRILGYVEPKIVGSSVNITAFDATAGKPYAKSIGMMVATV